MQSLRDFGDTRPQAAAGHPSRSRLPSPDRRPPAARNSRRFAWTGAIARGLAIAALAAGVAVTVKFGIPVAAIGHAADGLAVKIGLGVNQVGVSGSRNTLSADIFSALQLDQAGSLLSYDVASARDRLEALPWVAAVQLSRTLPDGLDVTIRERQPVAVWQRKQIMFLIDADGRTLDPTSRGDHPDLPLVVGEDADASARDLLDLLKAHLAIRDRLVAAVRVGGRRWDLQLMGAPTLMLPEDGAGDALAWLEKAQKDERVLDRRLTVIDLRVAGRVAVQVAPDLPATAGKPVLRLPDAQNRGA